MARDRLSRSKSHLTVTTETRAKADHSRHDPLAIEVDNRLFFVPFVRSLPKERQHRRALEPRRRKDLRNKSAVSHERNGETQNLAVAHNSTVDHSRQPIAELEMRRTTNAFRRPYVHDIVTEESRRRPRPVRSILTAQPFRAFIVDLVGGRSFTVRHPENAAGSWTAAH
jgi:hypothetical protein